MAQELAVETGDLARPDKKQSLSLFDLLDRYEREVVPRKRGRVAEAYVTRALKRHPLSMKNLKHITAGDFAKFRDERLQVVKASTLQRQLNVLRHALHTAEKEWGWTVPSRELASVSVPSAEHFHVERVSDDTVAALNKVLQGKRNRYVVAAVNLAVGTGMRRGELLSLTWDDVSIDCRTIYVRTTKNGSPRTLPLTPSVTRVLSEMERTTGLVLPISANCLKLAFQRARTAGGLTLRFHDLRHEAISRFFEMGLTIPEVQALSGHKTLSRLGRYAHPDVDRIAAKLGGTPEVPL